MLDACVFGNYWIYAAGLTDVELEVRVFDTSTGQTATYRNAAGQPFRPVADTSTFDGCFL